MLPDRKTIGIIGGMGPMATVDLFRKIVENTKASSDSEHLRILIDNNPQIPDRTECILQGSNAPLEAMSESAARLIGAGAELLAIPCNTAHYYYKALADRCSVPILNMPELAAEECRKKGYRRVGLLATEGCIKGRVHEPFFQERGIELIYPSEKGIETLMDLIYHDLKAGKAASPKRAYEELEAMKTEGAEVFMIACTELTLAFEHDHAFSYLDSTMLLVREAIICAGGMLKN